MKQFTRKKTIRLQHCDAGGIVFTPQYFNLFTEMLEDWFAAELNYPFSHMLGPAQSGTPAMRITARFAKPSRLGDVLDFKLTVARLTAKTVIVHMRAFAGDEFRCESDFHLGFVTLPVFGLTRWPAELFERMTAFAQK
jgi:4-hydroxybenzoyl-CoA thioesterase